MDHVRSPVLDLNLHEVVLRLIEAAERVTEQNGARPELVVLRGNLGVDSRKAPANNTVGIRADGTSG